MVQIRWTLIAKNDLKDISDYISKDSTKYAKLQIIRIKHRTQIVKQQIRVGKPVPEFQNEKIRELLEERYRIIYKIISEEQVDILTVHQSSRDLSKRRIK